MPTVRTEQIPADLQPLLEQNLARFSAQMDELENLQLPDRFTDDLHRVCIGSDFVAEQFSRRMGLLAELAGSGDLYREYGDQDYRTQLQAKLTRADREEDLHRLLREFRQREQIRLIWRDLTRLNDMRGTTRELSWLADACIDEALNWLHNSLVERYGQPMAKQPDGSLKPQYLVVLGMGKLGANELNLSSDIDLIFAFPENGETDGKRNTENQDFFIRLGKKLIQTLDNITINGFVFRTDMRLRPFGSAGPLAISFDAMEIYYQDQGREWERYAMIKARVVAGDRNAGAELMALLKPFVYRKYIDFSAFESLRDMKEMINREVRRKGREANVKLGSGGIREVEFIAQAFQLIRGGRDSRLQQRELLNILPLLPDAVGMPEEAVSELVDAYTFLRDAEHAIQAIADRQTQDLPVDERDQRRLAFSMGFDNWENFSAALEKHRDAVRRHFANVIAPAEEDTDDSNDSDRALLPLWEDELDDSEAITLLQEQGYDDAEASWKALRGLKESRPVQMLQQIARDRLSDVLPRLLAEISAVDNASETLERVLKLVQAVLRRSAYLVLLTENPLARQQLVRLCSASPWFGDQLAKQPILLDELIDPQSLYSPPDKAHLQAELRQQLLRIPEDDIEQLMEALRYFKNAHLLKVAASDITGALPLMKVSDYLTWTAETVLDAVLEIAWRTMTEKHGSPDNSDFIVLGYGKVGGIELSYGSDLDLVFIHNASPNGFTDGDKQIANQVFFTRLGQKIIHILNTFTPSGQLYEVDMRLRPSGNSGLLTSSLSAFRDYQLNEAWTWEHQALVRARVVAGSSALQQRYEEVRREILGQQREQAKLRDEVVEMRQKMRDHLGTKPGEQTVDNPIFNLKQDRGGIVDIEFLVQYLTLAYSHEQPQLLTWTDNIRILDDVESVGLLSAEECELLREAYKTYRHVGHRQTLQGQSGKISHDQMTESRDAVAAIWNRVMGQTES